MRARLLLDARLGVGARLAGAVAQRGDDLVDALEGQIGGADGGEQRGLEVVDVDLVLLSHGCFLSVHGGGLLMVIV